jgi:hypothetical protein
MFTKEEEVEYARIVARSWTDSEFRDQVIANPREIFRQYRISIPDSVEVSVRPGSHKLVVELGLPPKPEMKDEQIALHAQSNTPDAPRETPSTRADAPDKTRNDAPDKTRNDAPDHTRNDAPDRTRNDAPDRTRNDAPDRTRNDAPDRTRNDAPDRTRNDAPDGTRGDAPASTRGDASDRKGASAGYMPGNAPAPGGDMPALGASGAE